MNKRPPTRIRCNLTLDPAFVKAARKEDYNLSAFVERAGWEWLNRHAKPDRRAKAEGAKP